MTSGFGDSPRAGSWNGACTFQFGAPGEAECGPHFRRTVLQPDSGVPNWFRESAGYEVDLDGDGYDDVTLLYHQFVLTLSGRTGEQLGTTRFDVAESTEPASPKWFHSGRNYGLHTSSVDGDSVRTLMVGGVPIGTFNDFNCNVTRFIGLLETPIDDSRGVGRSRGVITSVSRRTIFRLHTRNATSATSRPKSAGRETSWTAASIFGVTPER